MQPLIFHKNKKQRRRKIVYVILTMIIAVLLMYYVPYTIIYFLMGFILIVEMYLLYHYTRNKPSVIVTSDGITSTVNGIGTVAWEFVATFEVKQGINFSALVIMIHNQEAFFANKNKLIKGIMQSNMQRFGSPIVIPEAEFNTPLTEVIAKIESYRQSFK